MSEHGHAEGGGELGPFAWLLANSAVMFLGAFACGMLPAYWTSLSEAKMKMVSTLGAGIIVGAALAVIIPEGVEAFYGAQTEGKEVPHGRVGAALTLGFVAMMVVDSAALSGGHGHSHGDHKHHKSPPGTDDEAEPAAECEGGRASMRTLVGLIIHSAADGFALGAAALSGSSDLNLMVFLAIMLHKAPAAFGLGTYLLHAKWSLGQVQRGIGAFSAAAPLAAIATYLLFQSTPALTTQESVGLVLLFSGGTFLYAATMHIMPEVLGASGHMTSSQVVMTAAGALFPLAISMLHSHDHGHAEGHAHGHGHAAHHHDLK